MWKYIVTSNHLYLVLPAADRKPASGFAVLTIIMVNMFWRKIKLWTPLRGSAPILLDYYKNITLQGLLHDYKKHFGDIWLTKLKSSYVKEMLVREFGFDIGFHIAKERMLYTILVAVAHILKMSFHY